MIFVMKMSLGMSSPNQQEDLDILTFDGIMLPFKLRITPLAGKPNQVNPFFYYHHYSRTATSKSTSCSKSSLRNTSAKNCQLQGSRIVIERKL